MIYLESINNLESKFFSVSEVAKILKVSKSTIIRMIIEGEIEAIRCRTLWKIAKEHILEYLKKNHSYNSI